MEFEDLTPEQLEKFKACKTPEELAALAKENGFELTDGELEDLAGGALPLISSRPCITKYINIPSKKSLCKGDQQPQQTEPEPDGQ